jgi:hypothetical protein
MKTSGKLFNTTLHGDPSEQIPYLKKNAVHGQSKETVEYAHCDLIVYRIII